MTETTTYDTAPLILVALVLFGLLVIDVAWQVVRRRLDRQAERSERNRQFHDNRRNRP